MLNQVVLVGRLTADPVKKEEEGHIISGVIIAVPRSYKNSDGEYETDFINCVLRDGIAINTSEFCHKGDIVGIKGRIEVKEITKGKKKEYITQVIAEKVTFLSSKKENEE